MIDLNATLDKLSNSANLPDKQQTLPTDEVAPFIEQPTQDTSVFTGESEMVAITPKEIVKTVVEGAQGLFTKGKKAADEVAPTPKVSEPVVAPIVIEKKKPITKTQQKEINKIQQEAIKEPIITTDDLKTISTQNAEKAAVAEEVKKLDEAEGIVTPTRSTDIFGAGVNSLDDLSENNLEDLILKSIDINKVPQSHDELIKAAEESGFDGAFLRQLREGTNFSETTAKSIALAKESLTKIKELALSSIGKEKTSAEYLATVREMQTYKYLLNKAYGIRQDGGRALNAWKIKGDSINIKNDIESIIKSGEIDDTMKMMLSDSLSDAQRAGIIKASLSPNGWAKAKLLYSAGILGRFGTQAKMITGELGNALVVEPIVRGGAATSWYATYPVKKMLGMSTEERYMFSEVFAMYKSLPIAFSNGWQFAKEAWATGRVAGSTLVDVDKSSFDILSYKDGDNFLNAGIKAINLLSSYGPRTLVAGGDFFKGVHYRMRIEAEATRKEIEAYGSAIDAGASHSDAQLVSTNARQLVYDNPPEALFDEAKKIVLEEPLPHVLQNLEKFARRDDAIGLAAKFTFTFSKTSINEFKRLIEHTPAGALAPSYKFLKSAFTGNLAEDLQSFDAKKVDMAVSKIGIGTAALSAGVYAANNDRLTGDGPTDKKLRDAMTNQGWRPKSLVFNISDATPEQLDKWKSIPLTTLGTGDYKGKIFVSYAGTGLIGSWLTLSANVSDYMRYEKDLGAIKNVVYGSSMGIASIARDTAYVNGIANAVKLFQMNNFTDDASSVDNVIQGLVSSGLRNAENMIPGIGIARTIRDFTDPKNRDIKPDATEDSAAIRGVEEAWNELKNSVPVLSKTLPSKINMWGESVSHEYPGLPYRASKGKQRLADKMIIQTGADVGLPQQFLNEQFEFDTLTTDANGTPNKLTVPVVVKLTDEEYKELVSIANVKYNLESEITKLQENLETYNRLYAADAPNLAPEQINRRNIKVIESLKNDIEKKVAEVYENARNDLYETSDYSSALKDRAQEEADQKMSQYKFPVKGNK